MPLALPIAAERRGACPTLDAPMPTGDGLLARLRVAGGRLTLAQLRGVADAAQRFGNGQLEISARGNLQVRGLRSETAAPFAAAIRTLVATVDGLVVETPPLAGDDPTEKRDPRPLAEAIGRAAVRFAGQLGPKVTVVVDGGGQLHLGGLKADIRVLASAEGWKVAVGGGVLRPTEDALGAVVEALEQLASRGPEARGTDLVGGRAFEMAAAVPLGRWARNGGHALGLALPFGAVAAQALMALADRAAAHGVSGFVLAPHHGLLALDAPDAFLGDAERLGFITDPADPRLRVSACVGSVGCRSGHMEARVLAGRWGAMAPADGHLHVSGCSKGCAHPSPAAVTLVGRSDGYGLVLGGRAGDTPAMILQDHQIEAALLGARRQG